MSDYQRKCFDAFVRGYLECMLFTCTDGSDESGGEPLDLNYEVSDVSEEALKAVNRDCRRFIRANADDLGTIWDWLHDQCTDKVSHCADMRAGELFWYTRNGHGIGFWDCYGADGVVQAACERLTDACKRFGELYPGVTDDGEICDLGEYENTMRVHVTFGAITDESASDGGHSAHGFMHPDEYRASDDDPCPGWSLHDAVRFMADKCSHVETCWTPENSRLGMSLSGTGCTEDCEGDEIEVTYDMNVPALAVGVTMDLKVEG